jgi:hypothetical protein
MDPPELPPALAKRIQQHEQLLADQDFYVLVWGSGESHSEDHAKRIAIYDYLASLFGADKVFMSEDERFRPLVERHGLRTAEAIQAGSIDGVVVLDTSIEPHSELHQYGDIILGKSIVFLKQEHKDAEGFSRVAQDALKVEGHTAEEYASCETIRRKSRDFLSGLQLKKTRLKPLQRLFGM